MREQEVLDKENKKTNKIAQLLPKEFLLDTYKIDNADSFFNFAENSSNLSHAIQLAQKFVAELFIKNMNRPESTIFDPLNSTQSWVDLMSAMMRHPERVAQAQLGLWQDYMGLWTNTLCRLMGEDVKPVIEPAKGDKRFKDNGWNEITFDFIKQSYLLVSKAVLETVEDVSEGTDQRIRDKISFFVKQFVDAMSPSNFALTNPEVLKATIQTNGENLVKGMQNLIDDLQRGDGVLSIKQTDYSAFKVGENLAVTPGKVIFQNDLIQLIQYTPSTETVFERPLLILSPWINKFYILDLQPKNSFIKWAVEQGFTVFVASWANPTEKHAHYGFEDYIQKGLFAALDAIEDATGEKQVSAIGYCIGGTMLSMGLALMKARGQNRITSATYFASQCDFTEAGELRIFADEQQIKNMRQVMASRGGFLEGHEMANTFNMLRANDLIWSFMVNNYLLAKEPFPFDLLYWNSDSTRMPMNLQIEYLTHCYINNDLAEKRMVVEDCIIDLNTIDIPMYFQASKEDHIAPANSVYKGMKNYSGKRRFVLAGSGHIAGVINHPDANKYQHWINEEAEKHLPSSLDEWSKNAIEHKGSWWYDWADWLAKYSGKKVKARIIDDGKLKPIENAPGSYVLE